MSAAAMPPAGSTLDDVLRAFDEPFGAACCRSAMRRAIGYLNEGTPQGVELALDILRATLRQVDGAAP